MNSKIPTFIVGEPHPSLRQQFSRGGLYPVRHFVTTDGFYVTFWCPMCEGVSHPATGCVYSPTFVVCWHCALEFAKWLQAWTNKRGRHGLSFFDHVRPPAAVDQDPENSAISTSNRQNPQ